MSLYALRSPAELCEVLKLGYSETQGGLMARLADARGAVDERMEDPEWYGDPLHAAVVAVLWRVLSRPGSRATVLAPSLEGSLACCARGTFAMNFLAEMCMTRDVCLRSISNCRHWNRVEFTGEDGWEVHLTPNVPTMVAEAASRSLIGLVIDAGNAQPAFVEAQRELEAVLKDPRAVLIRLW